jgi:hypothetical protein
MSFLDYLENKKKKPTINVVSKPDNTGEIVSVGTAKPTQTIAPYRPTYGPPLPVKPPIDQSQIHGPFQPAKPIQTVSSPQQPELNPKVQQASSNNIRPNFTPTSFLDFVEKSGVKRPIIQNTNVGGAQVKPAAQISFIDFLTNRSLGKVVGVDGSPAPVYKAPEPWYQSLKNYMDIRQSRGDLLFNTVKKGVENTINYYKNPSLSTALTPFYMAPLGESGNQIVKDFVREVLQGYARTMASIPITAMSMLSNEDVGKESQYEIKNDFIFGKDKKVEPLTRFAYRTTKEGRDYLESKGYNPLVSTVGGAAYGGLAFAGALSDFIPGSAGLRGLAKKIARTDDVNNILNILIKSGFRESDGLRRMAAEWVNVRDARIIEQELTALLDLAKEAEAIKPIRFVPDYVLATDEKAFAHEMDRLNVLEELRGVGAGERSASFPDWVPSDLRDKKLLDEVLEHIDNDTIPKDSRQRRLYEIIAKRMGDPYIDEVNDLTPLGKNIDGIKTIDESNVGRNAAKVADTIPSSSVKSTTPQASAIDNTLPKSTKNRLVPVGEGVLPKISKPLDAVGRTILNIPKPRTVVRTTNEAILLREKLRQQAKGAAYGVREGRRQIIEAMKKANADITAIKKQIIDYAKETIPLASRGKFLKTVADAKTQKNLIKAFTKIDAEADKVMRSDLIGRVKKLADDIESSASLAVDYKQRARALMHNIELQGHTSVKLEKLRKRQEYIDRMLAEGKSVNMPDKLIRELDILNRTRKADLTVPQLQNLVQELELIKHLGKTKIATRQALYKSKKAQIMAEIRVALERGQIRKLELGEMVARPIGGKLVIQDRLRNTLLSIWNKVLKLDRAITPTDAVFEDLGEPVYRNFKARTDANINEYYDMYDEIIDRFHKLLDDLGLDDSNAERIGVHAIRVQKGGEERLLAMGFTKEEINAIKLIDEEQEAYNFMRRELDGLRTPIEETLRVHYNKELGKVDDYFPFDSDWEKMNDIDMSERFGPNVPHLTKKTEQGFTKQRVGGKQPIKINAFDVFTRHIDNASYFVKVGPDNAMLFEIANRPEFAELVGNLGREYILHWLDTIARKGGTANTRRSPMIDLLRRNTGIAQLGLNVTSAIVQTTAIFDGAAQIGHYAFKGLGEVASDSAVREFLLENMPELRHRIGDDRAFNELFKSQIGKRAQKIGYYALRKLDGITASAVGWGAYLRKMDELQLPIDLANPNKEAIEYAQKIIRKTQGSGSFKDAPQVLTRGTLTGNISLDRAIFHFQSFALTRWSQIRNDLPRAIRNQDPKKAVNIITWLTVAYLAEEGIRRGMRELMDKITGNDEEERRSYLRGVLEQAFTTVPFISQLESVLIYQNDPIPLLEPWRTGITGIDQITHGKKNATKQRGVSNVVSGIGGIVGVPGTRQFKALLDRRIKAGEQDEKASKNDSMTPELPELPKLPKLPQLP